MQDFRNAYTDQTTGSDLWLTSYADEVNYVELRPGCCYKGSADDNA